MGVRTRAAARASEATLPAVGGVTLLRAAVPVGDEDLARLEAFAASGFAIFNPDRRRLQRALAADDPLLARLLAFLGAHGALRGRLVGPAVVLHSLPGCREQPMHTDYAPESVAYCRVKPLGVLLALQACTQLRLPERVVEMEAGDVLLFDGDQAHAGSAYGAHNTRVHLYLDAPGAPRPGNQTYPVRRARRPARSSVDEG